MPPSKIGFLLQDPNWDLSHRGAASLQVSQIIRALRASGHEVTLIVLRWGRQVLCVDGTDSERPSELRCTRATIFTALESVMRRIQSVLNLPWVQLFDSLRVVDACVQTLGRFDLIHERNSMYGFGGALAAWWLRMPYILSVDADFLAESDFVGTKLGKAQRLIAKRTAMFNYRAAQCVICVAEATRAHLISCYGLPPSKIRVIPNGVDVDTFHPGADIDAVRSRWGLDGGPVVIFVGGFYPWHGLDLLVDAFALVKMNAPNSKLILVGDGIKRPSVEDRILDCGLAESTILTGAVDHAFIPGLLAAADVAVAPYPPFPQEMWFSPLKLYEYMAAGKAIVASRCGQVAEVIQDGHNGRLVEAGNVQETARAITELLADPIERQRLGANARQQAVEQHSWTHCVERLEALYLDVLHAARGVRGR